MARFDVYRLTSDAVLVVDLQSDLIDNLDTRVVAPLLPLEEFFKAISRLNLKFELDGTSYVLVTHMLGTISLSDVRETVSRLADRDHDIIAATDFLFQGF